MKSKNPPEASRVPRGDAAAAGGRSGTGGRAVVLDLVQFRIEAFNREQGGGVLVHVRTATAIPWSAKKSQELPIARLRPKGDKGKYEVLYWSPDTDRWRSAWDIGGDRSDARRGARFHRVRSDGVLLDVVDIRGSTRPAAGTKCGQYFGHRSEK